MVENISSGGASMKVVGVLDDSRLQAGFRRVNQGFDRTKGKAEGFNADMTRMASVAGRVSTTLAAVGTAGAGALLGIASKAPAVAPALSRIKVQADRLARSTGKALEPAFNKAADAFSRMVGFAESHPKLISGLFKGAVTMAGIGIIGKVASKIISLYKTIKGGVGALFGAGTGAGWAAAGSVAGQAGLIGLMGGAAYYSTIGSGNALASQFNAGQPYIQPGVNESTAWANYQGPNAGQGTLYNPNFYLSEEDRRNLLLNMTDQVTS